ncbi:MAG: Zn-ribbon domain-containing OB-fold protein [Candidatus Bathyarchaeota archaeon]
MPNMKESIKKSIEDKGLPLFADGKTGLPLYISLRKLPLQFQFGVSKIQPFFKGLTEGKILMTKCKSCSEKFFPPQADCPKCQESNMDWIPLTGKGELLTCTMIFVKPTTHAHYDDYIVGIAEMEEGVRVLARVKTDKPKQIKPRMKLNLTVVKREPEGFLTYEFVPE